MLDIKFIRENMDLVKENCHKRQVKVDIDLLLELDDQCRVTSKRIEGLRAKRNKISKVKPSEEEIREMREVGDEIKNLEMTLSSIQDDYRILLFQIPNLTHTETPVGAESDFRIVDSHGKPSEFDFEPKDHETLMSALDLLDFERGTKVAATKFYFTKNDLVRLNLALVHYGIDIVTKYGYTLLETPDLAKNEILSSIGFNPRGKETQVYSIENTDLSLIGTAEITLGGFHADEILDLNAGPKKYVGISHCFRTEAGAHGRENKGLYRVHQFNKLEMFIFCKPEESEALHQELVSIEREILDGLKLAYRVIDVASSDLGGPAFRKFDIEAWMSMKNDYGEITSASNCTDYQSRRLNIRYRQEDGGTAFAHTLNGTAIVSSRFPLAIAENYQQADGTIRVPDVLQKYMGKKIIGF